MKNIILFLLFPLLLLFVIGIVFVQLKGNRNKDNVSSLSHITHTQIQPSQIPTSSQQNTNEINLTISTPQSGISVDSDTIVVAGSTEPGSSVIVNDKEMIASKNGGFSVTIPLDEGENYISVVTYNEAGGVSQQELLVTRAVVGL